MSRRKPYSTGDDPLVHRMIREALDAPADERERPTLPKPVARESLRPWSLQPAPKRSPASVAHQRYVRAAELRRPERNVDAEGV